MKGRIWILLVILLLVVIWMYKSYREPLTQSPSVSSVTSGSSVNSVATAATRPPQTVQIPPFISKIDKCDYPLAIQYARIFLSDSQIKEYGNVCSSSNPQNITNQAEVCRYITDLSSAYSGKMMDTCPRTITFDGDQLNQVSVCKLPAFLSNLKQAIMTDTKKSDKEVDTSIQTQLLQPLTIKCSQGNRNACIIGNALVGNLPSYCSMNPASSPPPTAIPAAVAAGGVMM